MKIYSGAYKGLNLISPKGLEITRPTKNKVREAVFDIFQNEIQDANFADLFSGSGAMGIESLSRGATSVLFLESNPNAVEALKKNLAEVQRRALVQGLEPVSFSIFDQNIETIRYSSKLTPNVFNVIWADPPYQQITFFSQYINTFLEKFAANGAYFILESPSGPNKRDIEVLPMECAPSFEVVKKKVYGQTQITIWRNKK